MKEYLIEKGNERKYVPEAELATWLRDGWSALGYHTVPLGASVPQPEAAAETPRPQGKGKNKREDKDDAVG